MYIYIYIYMADSILSCSHSRAATALDFEPTNFGRTFVWVVVAAADTIHRQPATSHSHSHRQPRPGLGVARQLEVFRVLAGSAGFLKDLAQAKRASTG